jgi:large subunit ribosomal protein L24
MRRIRTKDQIYILSGNFRGEIGEVEKVVQDKVWVKRMNMVVRHKRNPQEPGKGFKINKNVPFHISKVALLNPNTEKPGKVKMVWENGKKLRVFKADNSKVN